MRALVTNCTRNSGLAVMHALHASGWQVCGADDRVFAFGLHSRSAMAPYELLPAEDDPRFVAALTALLDRLRPEVLMPTRGIEAACGARNTLRARTGCLLPSSESFACVNDKSRLLPLCVALGVEAPQPMTLAEARHYLEHTPEGMVVVKPCRDAGGGQGVIMLRDPAALEPALAAVADRHGPAFICEYVPGPITHLRAVHLLFDADSRLIAFFILRKQRIWPARVGVTVAGVSTHEADLLRGVVPLLQRLRWQGPADAEFKIDARDGRPKLLEINPRFSGAIQFAIGSGVDFATLYARAALGEQLPEAAEPAYAQGLRYVDTTRWLAGAATELCAAPGQLRSWLRSCRDELAQPRVPPVQRLADPAPLLGKLLPMRRYGPFRA